MTAYLDGPRERKWWTPISHFAGHVFVGSVLFCIIALPAIGLALAVNWLSSQGVPEFTIRVLKLLEHTILIADSALYLVYLAVTGLKAVREMLE